MTFKELLELLQLFVKEQYRDELKVLHDKVEKVTAIGNMIITLENETNMIYWNGYCIGYITRYLDDKTISFPMYSFLLEFLSPERKTK